MAVGDVGGHVADPPGGRWASVCRLRESAGVANEALGQVSYLLRMWARGGATPG